MIDYSDQIIITENSWGHIASETYKSVAAYAFYLSKMQEMRDVAAELNFRLYISNEDTTPPSFWNEEKQGEYVPHYSTCMNATKLNTPEDRPTWIGTSACETSLTNIQRVIDFMKETA